MKVFDIFKKKKTRKYFVGKRNFASAKQSNLFSGWFGTNLSADQELVNNLETIRNRVRQVCNDNEYARKFLQIIKSNVIHNGIRLQAVTKRDDGSLDSGDNDRLEKAWKVWSDKKEFVSVNHRLNWVDFQRLVIETLARDGEVFVRKIKTDIDNPFNFSLQILEGDWFDIGYNKPLNNGNYIVMSVEQNQYGRPSAFYKYVNPPNGLSLYSSKNASVSKERIPAEDIIHLYIPERPSQSRGLPWLNTVLRSLEMLYQYQESELVASRIGASSMGFYTSPDSAGYTGSDQDAQGNLITEFQPGTFQQLPDGVKFESFNPEHPTTAYIGFCKSVLRAISSGLGISYASLASDLESVNYSSIRAGVQEDRAYFSMLQHYVIENLCRPVYKDWLRMAITTGWLDLPMSKIDKFEEVIFIPRGWDYVDPLKEIKAQQTAVQMGVMSLTEIASGKGKDINEVMYALKKDIDLAKELDLTLDPPVSPVQQVIVTKEEEPEEEE